MEILAAYQTDREGLSTPTVVCIGNFDGGHLGHQSLAKLCLQQAEDRGLKSLALTFDPNPSEFFGKRPKGFQLFSEEQKQRFFAELGFDAYLSQPFTKEFSQIDAEAFCEGFLHSFLHAKVLVVGENFRFGFKRGGDVVSLKAFCLKRGIDLHVVSGVTQGGDWISSSRIRDCLQNSERFFEVASLLGRPYMLEGRVRSDHKLGRKVGYPTANLGEVKQMLPPFGVYAGYAFLAADENSRAASVLTVDSQAWQTVFNVGFSPTFNHGAGAMQPKIEGHVIDPRYQPQAHYGFYAAFYLCHFLRPEETFAGIDELKVQIQRDITQAKRLLV